MNPVLPLSLLIPLILAVMGAAAWMSWRSSEAAPGRLRKILLLLRLLALFALGIFLINPGQWQAVQDQVTRVWAVMIDNSQSMSTQNAETPRIEVAQKLQQQISKSAKKAGVAVRYYAYSDSIQEIEASSKIDATATISDLTSAADTLLTQLSAQGAPLAAVIVLSDGRQTHTPRHSSFKLRAQAMQVPFYAIPIGGNQISKDLDLQVAHKTITAFPGQNVQITAVIDARELGAFDTNLSVIDADGKTIDQAKLKIKSGTQTMHTFSLKAPEKSTIFTLKLPAQAGEMRLSNNKIDVRLRILDDKAKVFIAEGAPYWDSKFLTQLLRKQKHMDVVSVHRLSETRWFRIDSGESKPHESNVDVFPDTKEELMKYDLIIFGKNSEHFLTPQRIANLRSFVKDQGGAVLFSRSKPYTGTLPDLAALEPVTWKTGVSGKFKMRPSSDGQAAGLFGQALPAPDSSVWSSLPELKDAHRIDVVKPFTRVLAYGEMENANTQGRLPLLLVRRYGQGVTGLVNADGLWKWDFFPEARELGNMYHEFWIQMIHWMLAYSEFLPGQNYSFNLSASIIEPGTPVALRIGYRGTGLPGVPQIEVTSPMLDAPLRLAPAKVPTDDGRLKWGASFTPEKPGNYQLRLIAAKTEGQSQESTKASSMPEATITVTPPLGEMDELSADPEFLSEFCAMSGGKLAPSDDLSTFLADVLKPVAPETLDRGVEWHSSWMRWFSPILLLSFLALEWWLRRRNGLV